jgi:hypothetical protein
MSRRAHAVALAGAAAVFLLLLVALRLRNWLPFFGAALAYLGLLWAWHGARPGADPARDAPLPPGISAEDHRAALDALDDARRRLGGLAAEAPPADAAVIARMAALVEAIGRHHRASPGHVARTRTFMRHTLPRMVAAVADYVDLARRAAPGISDERLAEVSRRLADFVPVLENIDRACLDDDLTSLEINVEVLDEQLGRGSLRRRG